MSEILTIWFGLAGQKRWSDHVDAIVREIEDTQARSQDLQRSQRNSESRVDALHEAYLGVGGSDVDELRRRLEEDEATLQNRRKNGEDYRKATQQFGLDGELSEVGLRRNIEILKQREPELREARDAKHEECA